MEETRGIQPEILAKRFAMNFRQNILFKNYQEEPWKFRTIASLVVLRRNNPEFLKSIIGFLATTAIRYSFGIEIINMYYNVFCLQNNMVKTKKSQKNKWI